MSPTDDQLRRALELCFAVAVAGTRLRPALAAPPALRAFLKFQKLPASALPAVRKVVEDDDDFRYRVAIVATEELVGPIGLIWLNRPEGWVETLQELVEDAADRDEQDAAAPVSPKEQRRRMVAERAATKAQGELAALKAAYERELDQRRAAEARAREATAKLEALQSQVDEALETARTAKARSANAAATAESAHETKRQLQQRLAETERRLTEALVGRAEAETRAADLERVLRSSPAVDSSPTPSAPELDRAATALQDTAGALRRLAEALDTTGGALTGGSAPNSVRSATSHPPAPPARSSSARSSSARASGRPSSQRVPLGIPGGLFGDSVAAAEHLVRQSKVAVVVDGYNVAMLGWPNLTLELQREALVAALDDLVRRLSTRVIAVFDGADVPAVAARRRLVRVKFSPPGVTADDSIRDLVAGIPDNVPVVVATNDQEIVRDVRQLGANVVSSEQLLAVVRR